MIHATEIIIKKIRPEGVNLSKEALAALALEDLKSGKDLMLSFGKTVFTVSKDKENPQIHLYSDDAGYSILLAYVRFMRIVWKRVDHKFLLAPISDRRLQRLVERFGWKALIKQPIGNLYFIERPT